MNQTPTGKIIEFRKGVIHAQHPVDHARYEYIL